jgi:hypothetical protein
VLQEDAALELRSLGNSQRLLHYNSPDMSGVHRTVRCNCGATTTSRQRSPAGAFNARQKRAEVRHARAGTPDIEQYMSGVHRTSRRAQKLELQRSNPSGFGDVAGAPDMSGVHRTVRCAPDCPMHHTTDSLHQTIMFGGWGYKYPQPPHHSLHPSFPLLNHLQELGIQF